MPLQQLQPGKTLTLPLTLFSYVSAPGWLLRHYGTSQTLPSNSSAQWAFPIQCCWSGFPSQVSCVLLRNDRHMGLSIPHNTPQPGFPLGNALSEGPVAPLAEFPLGEEETDCCSPASSLAPILLLLSEGKAQLRRWAFHRLGSYPRVGINQGLQLKLLTTSLRTKTSLRLVLNLIKF